jgi:hypothetical protein
VVRSATDPHRGVAGVTAFGQGGGGFAVFGLGGGGFAG